MKKTKRILIFTLILISICCFSFLNNKAEAATVTKDDTETATWAPTTEETERLNGVEHILAHGKSTYNGVSSEQQINVFKLKTNGVTSKLVNWAILDGNSGYKRGQLTKIAEDYEKNHPGWTVIAGINADQYAQVFGAGGGNNYHLYSAPYYPMIIDGEVRFPFVSVNGAASAYVGFTNDGSSDGIVDASPLKCFALYILDASGKEIAEFELEGINKNASSNQSTVWTSVASHISSGQYISKEVSTTNNLYFVEKAELAYSQTNEFDVFFGKGTITSTPTNATVGEGQFAIETSNQEVINALKVGVRIKVQAKYHSDAMNSVETAAGFHMIHRNNGVDQIIPGYSPAQLNSQYDARQYNRSIFGQTADGTYVLITADKSNGKVEGTKYAGLRFWETNAVLKHYGVTEAYQQDGGGSVTAIMRNSSGGFDVVNTPSDSAAGTQRSVLNGLFFVVKDPGFEASKQNITRNSIKITLKENNLFSQMENIKVSINNKTYDMPNEELLIEGLEESTEYLVKISYDYTENGKKVSDVYEMKVRTKDFKMPDSGLEILSINKNSITIQKKNTEYSSWIKEVYVNVSGENYYMGSETEFTIENLIDDTDYTVYFTYEVHEPTTGNIYHGQDDEQRITTLSVELPKIIKFNILETTATTIKVEYEYEDEDDAIVSAKIYYGQQSIDLTRKRGTITIENLDLTKYEYKVSLSLIYYANEDSAFADEVKEDLMTQKIVVEPSQDEPKKGCGKSSTQIMIYMLSSLSLITLIIKKRK